MKGLLGFFPFLLLATVVGCEQQDKLQYANVKGKVTYNGKPLDKGEITFAVAGKPPSTMQVMDGEFSGQAMVGSNKISVHAKRKAATQTKLPPGAMAQLKGYRERMKGEFGGGGSGGSGDDFDLSAVDYIPPDWGPQSKQMRVVEAGQTNEFEFNIKGK